VSVDARDGNFIYLMGTVQICCQEFRFRDELLTVKGFVGLLHLSKRAQRKLAKQIVVASRKIELSVLILKSRLGQIITQSSTNLRGS
jgi:hypothetical protein